MTVIAGATLTRPTAENGPDPWCALEVPQVTASLRRPLREQGPTSLCSASSRCPPAQHRPPWSAGKQVEAAGGRDSAFREVDQTPRARPGSVPTPSSVISTHTQASSTVRCTVACCAPACRETLDIPHHGQDVGAQPRPDDLDVTVDVQGGRVPKSGRVGGDQGLKLLAGRHTLDRAVQVVDRLANLLDRCVDLVDRLLDPRLDPRMSGQSRGRLQRQPGREEALAAAAGVAIDNARLYEASRRQRRWSDAVGELTQVFLEAEDAALRLVVDHAVQLAGATRALVAMVDEIGVLRVGAGATHAAEGSKAGAVAATGPAHLRRRLVGEPRSA